jgi:hypothetical protein
LGEPLLDVFEAGAGALEYLGLSGELVAGEQIEASEVGAQHGPKVGLEVVTHVLDRGRHALEKPASEIVDAEIHVASSFAPY